MFLRKSYKGAEWYYDTDITQPDKTKIQTNIKTNVITLFMRLHSFLNIKLRFYLFPIITFSSGVSKKLSAKEAVHDLSSSNLLCKFHFTVSYSLRVYFQYFFV